MPRDLECMREPAGRQSVMCSDAATKAMMHHIGEGEDVGDLKMRMGMRKWRMSARLRR